MPIDAYSICPGGTGKKMKFCCPDFVGELEKINRMIEGDQFLAALQHIERLDEQGRQRACVMAIQAMLLRETHQFEAALAHVAEFLLRHPENPIAWAESAILTAAGEGGRAAIRRLQRRHRALGPPDEQHHLRGHRDGRRRADRGRRLDCGSGVAALADAASAR